MAREADAHTRTTTEIQHVVQNDGGGVNDGGGGEGLLFQSCDPFGIPSTSRWTGAAIIVQSHRTKICIVTRSRTANKLMPTSLAG